MRNGRLQVLEPLLLVSVRRIDRRLRVVAHDHAQRRHVLFFRVPAKQDARSHERVMMKWMHDRTSIAYVRGARSGALVNVEQLFAPLM